MSLEVIIEDLAASGVAVTGHGEDLAVAHAAADGRIDAAQPGWQGQSAAALAATAAQWSSRQPRPAGPVERPRPGTAHQRRRVLGTRAAQRAGAELAALRARFARDAVGRRHRTLGRRRCARGVPRRAHPRPGRLRRRRRPGRAARIQLLGRGSGHRRPARRSGAPDAIWTPTATRHWPSPPRHAGPPTASRRSKPIWRSASPTPPHSASKSTGRQPDRGDPRQPAQPPADAVRAPRSAIPARMPLSSRRIRWTSSWPPPSTWPTAPPRWRRRCTPTTRPCSVPWPARCPRTRSSSTTCGSSSRPRTATCSTAATTPSATTPACRPATRCTPAATTTTVATSPRNWPPPGPPTRRTCRICRPSRPR